MRPKCAILIFFKIVVLFIQPYSFIRNIHPYSFLDTFIPTRLLDTYLPLLVYYISRKIPAYLLIRAYSFIEELRVIVVVIVVLKKKGWSNFERLYWKLFMKIKIMYNLNSVSLLSEWGDLELVLCKVQKRQIFFSKFCDLFQNVWL